MFAAEGGSFCTSRSLASRCLAPNGDSIDSFHSPFAILSATRLRELLEVVTKERLLGGSSVRPTRKPRKEHRKHSPLRTVHACIRTFAVFFADDEKNGADM
jgi:hypothetical protein